MQASSHASNLHHTCDAFLMSFVLRGPEHAEAPLHGAVLPYDSVFRAFLCLVMRSSFSNCATEEHGGAGQGCLLILDSGNRTNQSIYVFVTNIKGNKVPQAAERVGISFLL